MANCKILLNTFYVDGDGLLMDCMWICDRACTYNP